MVDDVFGNLREWSQVPAQIAGLQSGNRLDEHQEGLIRILRYRDNWRLREIALAAAKDLKRPSAELLGQLLGIAADEGVYDTARLLALQALTALLADKARQAEERIRFVNELNTLLTRPASPLVREALRKSLASLCHGVSCCRPMS